MDSWRAGLIGLGIVLIGFGGYSSLDGIWKGMSLVAAGIALVLLGLSLERKPRVAEATAGDAEPEGSSDDLDVTVPLAAVAVEEAEPTAPIVRTEPKPDAEPAPSVSEPEVAVPEVSKPDTPDEPATASEAMAGPVDEASTKDEDETAHSHDQPMLGHSELVSHIRDYHESVPFDGSTIQLRLLHERAHA